MVKINEFADLDIPKEIYPKPDYDVKEDLKIYMRNDPMFYRKAFFPAMDEYRQTKNKKCLNDMVDNGLKNYCTKFGIKHKPEDIISKADLYNLVDEIIKDEQEDIQEAYDPKYGHDTNSHVVKQKDDNGKDFWAVYNHKGKIVKTFYSEKSASTYAEKNHDALMKNEIKANEGKSPHKKGTKKYKKHMAAIHAGS